LTALVRCGFLGAGLGASAAALAVGPAFSGLFANANDAIEANSNPAALTRIEHPEWEGELLAFATPSNEQYDATIGAQHFSASSQNTGSFAIPGVYYAKPWNERLGVGLSLYVPSGLGSDPGSDSIGRYLLEKWSLGLVSLSPAVGYRIDDKLSVGFAVNLNYTLYDYQAAVFNGPGQADGTMELKGGAFGAGFSAGLLYEQSPDTRYGLSYRSATSSTLNATPSLSGLTPQREQILAAAGFRNISVKMTSRFPQLVGAGAWHRFENGATASLDVSWIDFRQFGLTQLTLGNVSVQTDIDRCQATWMSTAGSDWPIDERWTAQFGAIYVTPPVSDQNRSLLLQLDRIWGLGAGAKYRWGGDKTLTANLNFYNLVRHPVNSFKY